MGQAFKIGDQVVGGVTLGTMSGGHLHFQVMTFQDGAFDSSITNTALTNITVGGTLLTSYKLGGNAVAVADGVSYKVTGTPIPSDFVKQSNGFSQLSFAENQTINATTSGSSATMTEGSPAYIWSNWTIPLDATFLSFDFLWGNRGDGDVLSVYFGDTLLFSFLGTDFAGNDFLNSGLLWVGQFAGQTDQLLFALNNVGEVNADLTLQNLTLHSVGQVPTPATIVLLAIGLWGLVVVRCRYSADERLRLKL